LSNIGIYGTGQAYEQLLLRMRAHPLPEAQSYADLMLTELRKVIPSFLQRVDVAERGGEWSAYLASNRDQTRRVLTRLWPDLADSNPVGASAAKEAADRGDEEVVLLDFDPDGEEKVLVAACFSQLGCSEREAARRVRVLGHDDRVALLRAYVGDRRNRRHRPGRGFERTDYRFELVTDYGAFRDLQRHRMLTVEWQRLGVSLGYDMPDLVAESGLGDRYDEAISRAEDLYWSLAPDFPEQASYAAALAHRIRYILQLNAREAMHLIELRSGTQGHPAYRRVAQQMHRAIAEVAGHRALAEAMSFVDHGATDLERLESERRAERRRTEKSATR
jgi:thymidylate synthase ThyX